LVTYSWPNGVQLLVETHSEHLLHRIQRRIAEEQITKDDLALYFIETSQGRSEIHEPKVYEYGNSLTREISARHDRPLYRKLAETTRRGKEVQTILVVHCRGVEQVAHASEQ
jgi:hypothetical protein